MQLKKYYVFNNPIYTHSIDANVLSLPEYPYQKALRVNLGEKARKKKSQLLVLLLGPLPLGSSEHPSILILPKTHSLATS